MKLDAVLKLIAPFLAKDAKPDAIKATVIAADKKAKDSENTGLGPKTLQGEDKAARDKAYDAMSDEDKKSYDAMPDEEKCAKDAELCEKGKAMDAPPDVDAEDDELSSSDPKPPGGNREKGKTAVDSAEVDRRIADAVKKANVDSRALHTAQDECAPIIGRVALDSAEAVYRAALTHLGVANEGVHASALPAMLKMAKDTAAAKGAAPVLGMDTSQLSAFAKIIPNYDRLK
jgi:hypothetical protein